MLGENCLVWNVRGLNSRARRNVVREMVDQEMQRHGFRTPLGSGPGSLHFLGLKLDWIYLRGLRALGSGVTPISFSDHNSVWVLAGP